MTIKEYQNDAMRTISEPEHKSLLLEGLMGLNGEAGECIDVYKKHLFQGHDLDTSHMASELGDVAWYLAISAAAIGYDLEVYSQFNADLKRIRRL